MTRFSSGSLQHVDKGLAWCHHLEAIKSDHFHVLMKPSRFENRLC